jgi:glutamate/tyrosine decarboxylase-like PLP-dependent enzyme
VQWSRRFIGLKLFLSLAHHGEAGYAEQLERQARMGCVLKEALTSSGWRIVNNSPLPVVCFTRDGLNTARFLGALKENQIAWMSEVQLREQPVLRACITSFRTTEADIAWVVREMNRIIQ